MYTSGLTSLASHDWLIKEKRESLYCFARPACRGLRIAHRSRTSKLAEASRRICYTPMTNAHAFAYDGIYISTLASTVCCILDYDLKVAKFLQAKKERRVNAFHYVFANPPTLPVTGLLRCGLHLPKLRNISGIAE